MQRTIKPEILFILGLLSFKLIPDLIASYVLAGIIVFASMLILLIGASGIAQRNRVSFVIFLIGFGIMFGTFFFDKILDSNIADWRSIGPVGDIFIYLSILISWGISLFKKLRANAK